MKDLVAFTLDGARVAAVAHGLASRPFDYMQKCFTRVGKDVSFSFALVKKDGSVSWGSGPSLDGRHGPFEGGRPVTTPCVLHPSLSGFRSTKRILRAGLVWCAVQSDSGTWTDVLAIFHPASKTLSVFRVSGDASPDAPIIAMKALAEPLRASNVVSETSPVPIVPHAVLEAAGVPNHEAGVAAFPLLAAMTMWGFALGEEHPGALTASRMRDPLTIQQLLFSIEALVPAVRGGSKVVRTQVHDHGTHSALSVVEEPLRTLVAFADKPSVMMLKLRVLNALRVHDKAGALHLLHSTLKNTRRGAPERHALCGLHEAILRHVQ